MPKKPVAVSLRKPQAPADVDGFVGGPAAPAPARPVPVDPIGSASDVQHGARDYREMTLYLPTEVARELSFYCMDRNCDVNRVVADAVAKHVSGEAAPAIAAAPNTGWAGTLEAIVEQLRTRLGPYWPLRS